MGKMIKKYLVKLYYKNYDPITIKNFKSRVDAENFILKNRKFKLPRTNMKYVKYRAELENE